MKLFEQYELRTNLIIIHHDKRTVSESYIYAREGVDLYDTLVYDLRMFQEVKYCHHFDVKNNPDSIHKNSIYHLSSVLLSWSNLRGDNDELEDAGEDEDHADLFESN